MPLIVIHGDRDTTVAPVNAEGVIAARLAAGDITDQDPPITTRTDSARGYNRTVHRNQDRVAVAESLIVHGGGHAWYGGNPVGSYTDPDGPDSSAEMIGSSSSAARPRAQPEPARKTLSLSLAPATTPPGPPQARVSE